jgi:hypothetical protein
MTTILFRTLLLLVFLGVLPVACCKQETLDYIYIQGMTLALADAAGAPLLSGANTTTAALEATLRFQFGLVAQAPSGEPFAGPAQATRCPDEGTKGLKTAVTEVVLTSTGLFNGQVAGQSLNAFVRCSLGNNGGSRGADFPLSQLADSLNAKNEQGLRIYQPVFLRISPKPTDNARQQFQVRLRVASAPDLTQSTPEISWN